MKQKLKAIIILLSVPFFVALALKTQSVEAQKKAQTAGEKFKNIKVLNDMPADQMGKVMNIIAASLGKDCNFCHIVDQFDKDDKKEKATAREMMKMTFEINKDHFKGRTEVTCNSCHNGHEQPQNVPNLMPAPPIERPKQPDVKPTVDQIVAKYIAALGGQAKLAKITSQTIKASRIEPDGKITHAESIWFKTNKYALATTYDKTIVTELFDGTDSGKFANAESIVLKPDEAEQIKREAELFSPANIKAIYPKMDFRFVDRIDGREVYQVIGTTAGNVRERLFFDVITGLLVRRSAATPTMLGNFVYQVDYADYKSFGGVKYPTTIHYSMPSIRWTRKVLDLKNNAPVDDAIFTRAMGTK